jgi:hypothetical protein
MSGRFCCSVSGGGRVFLFVVFRVLINYVFAIFFCVLNRFVNAVFYKNHPNVFFVIGRYLMLGIRQMK